MEMQEDQRSAKPRADLSEFLRAKRAELSRDDFGICHTGRMRSKGLRREDIAYLTHVSLTWYTWLEQGRDISVSPRLLSRLASTLRLNEAERRYLFRLCGLQPSTGRNLLKRRMSARVSSPIARDSRRRICDQHALGHSCRKSLCGGSFRN